MRPRRGALRGAIIGFGQVAEKAHAEAFRSHRGFSIVAAVDESPARLERARACLPGAAGYASLDELLKSEPALDFVDIATPPFLHGRQVLAALKAGLHVLCEKPLTLDRAELAAIQAAAEKGRRAVFTVHNWRYSSLFLKLDALVRAGSIGAVDHAELHTLRDKPAAAAGAGWRTDPRRAGGGILVDHGWHSLYLLHRLIGQSPREISAHLGRAGGAVEQEAAVFMTFPSATAFLRLTWRAGARANWGAVSGRGGSVDLRDDHLLLHSGGRTRRIQFKEKLSHGSAHPGWFRAMLDDFYAEATDPAARGLNFREAKFCLETLHRIYGR